MCIRDRRRLDQGAYDLGGARRGQLGQQPVQGGAFAGGEPAPAGVRVALLRREFAVHVRPGPAVVEIAEVLVVVVQVVGLHDPAVEPDLAPRGHRQGAQLHDGDGEPAAPRLPPGLEHADDLAAGEVHHGPAGHAGLDLVVVAEPDGRAVPGGAAQPGGAAGDLGGAEVLGAAEVGDLVETRSGAVGEPHAGVGDGSQHSDQREVRQVPQRVPGGPPLLQPLGQYALHAPGDCPGDAPGGKGDADLASRQTHRSTPFADHVRARQDPAGGDEEAAPPRGTGPMTARVLIPARRGVNAYGRRLDEGLQKLEGARGSGRAPVRHPHPPLVGHPG